MAPTQSNAVLRVLNQIDYSVVNEFCRLQQTPTILAFGNLLCSFLSFTQKQPTDYYELCWFEICADVKKTISGSLFEFKEKIKTMARSRDDSLLLRKIKLTLIENKHTLRSYIRQSRALRIFTQLCWLTASTMLNEKDDLKDDLYGEYARLITT